MNVANVFNIENTLNTWFNTQIATYSPPAFFSGFDGDRVIFDMPEQPLQPPQFSASHLFIRTEDLYQGRRVSTADVGQRYYAFMDISAWVTRGNANWLAELRWMASILNDAVNQALSVNLTEFLDDYPNSSSANQAIYIDGLEARQVGSDPSPDLKRERFLVRYHTLLRS